MEFEDWTRCESENARATHQETSDHESMLHEAFNSSKPKRACAKNAV